MGGKPLVTKTIRRNEICRNTTHIVFGLYSPAFNPHPSIYISILTQICIFLPNYMMPVTNGAVGYWKWEVKEFWEIRMKDFVSLTGSKTQFSRISDSRFRERHNIVKRRAFPLLSHSSIFFFCTEKPDLLFSIFSRFGFSAISGLSLCSAWIGFFRGVNQTATRKSFREASRCVGGRRKTVGSPPPRPASALDSPSSPLPMDVDSR